MQIVRVPETHVVPGGLVAEAVGFPVEALGEASEATAVAVPAEALADAPERAGPSSTGRPARESGRARGRSSGGDEADVAPSLPATLAPWLGAGPASGAGAGRVGTSGDTDGAVSTDSAAASATSRSQPDGRDGLAHWLAMVVPNWALGVSAVAPVAVAESEQPELPAGVPLEQSDVVGSDEAHGLAVIRTPTEAAGRLRSAAVGSEIVPATPSPAEDVAPAPGTLVDRVVGEPAAMPGAGTGEAVPEVRVAPADALLSQGAPPTGAETPTPIRQTTRPPADAPPGELVAPPPTDPRPRLRDGAEALEPRRPDTDGAATSSARSGDLQGLARPASTDAAPPPVVAPAAVRASGPSVVRDAGPSDPTAAADRLLRFVAERIHVAVGERRPALEARFHDPALGPVRLSVSGLPDGPIAVTIIVTIARAARAIERAAREAHADGQAPLAGIDLRIRTEVPIGGPPAVEPRPSEHRFPGSGGAGDPSLTTDAGPGRQGGGHGAPAEASLAPPIASSKTGRGARTAVPAPATLRPPGAPGTLDLRL